MYEKEGLVGIIPGHSLEIHYCNPLTVEIYTCYMATVDWCYAK